jgi:sec-independent protein translocase protein TatB
VFNVTGSELVIILLVALIVLGPEKLPDAIRKFGRVYGELRRMSSGFQSELRDALEEPMREMRDTMNTMTGGFDDGSAPTQATPSAGPRLTPDGAVVEADAPGTPPADDSAVAPVADDSTVTPVADVPAAGPPNGTPPAATNGTNGTNGSSATSATTGAVPADEPVVPADPD